MFVCIVLLNTFNELLLSAYLILVPRYRLIFLWTSLSLPIYQEILSFCLLQMSLNVYHWQFAHFLITKTWIMKPICTRLFVLLVSVCRFDRPRRYVCRRMCDFETLVPSWTTSHWGLLTLPQKIILLFPPHNSSIRLYDLLAFRFPRDESLLP